MPQTFLEFLQERGKLNASDSEKDVLKKEFKRFYFKEMHALRKQTHKRIELWFLKTDFIEFEKEAKHLELKPAQLLKEYIRGYREKRYIRSKDSRITGLIKALNKWGSSVNTISYKNSSLGALTSSDVQELKDLFYRMCNTIDNELKHVPLEEFIRVEYKRNPRFLEYLMIISEAIQKEEQC